MRLTRRSFLRTSAASALAAAGLPPLPWHPQGPSEGLAGVLSAGAEPPARHRNALRVPRASNRVTLATIGVGPRGVDVMRMFLSQPDVQVVAVCDVNAQRRDAVRDLVNQHYGATSCGAYGDFRDVLARDDIDAVHVAAPDHWHVPIALAAARAGKDMYIEKPLGLSLAANQALREAVRAHGAVFQFGTQHRSERNFRFGCELVRNGRIGRLHTIRVGSLPSLERAESPPEPVPDWLDWEMWLGPAPWAPFTSNRIINQYWWHTYDYSLGFVAGYGVHYVDIAQWGNDTELSGPVEVEGAGVFPKQGMCDCATSWDVRLRYANGVTMVYTDTQKTPEGITFEGDEGKVYVTLGRVEAEPKSLLKTVWGPNDLRLYESRDHVRNLVDCIKTRTDPICPIEVAVRSDTLCHLSDIAMRLRRRLRWDPARECFEGDAEANRMLTRAMREPWRL